MKTQKKQKSFKRNNILQFQEDDTSQSSLQKFFNQQQDKSYSQSQQDDDDSFFQSKTKSQNMLNSLFEPRPLTKNGEKYIQEQIKNVSIKDYCENKNKYRMKKPFMKVEVSVFLPFYDFSYPFSLINDSAEETFEVQNYIPKISTYFDNLKQQQQEFIPNLKQKPLSIKDFIDFIDPIWLVKQNTYLLTLTPYQRALIFAYTNQSHKSSTPFLLNELNIKTTPIETLWERYKTWREKKIVPVNNIPSIDPVSLTFFYSIHDEQFLSLFPKNLITQIEKLKMEKYNFSNFWKFISKNITVEMYRSLMLLYFKQLYVIFNNAPVVDSPFYLFRREPNFERYKTRHFENYTFVSCSNDEKYINALHANRAYIRFHIGKGSKLIFVKGLSYYPIENEFILSPSCFSNIKEIDLRIDLCKTIKAYDISIKPLKNHNENFERIFFS